MIDFTGPISPEYRTQLLRLAATARPQLDKLTKSIAPDIIEAMSAVSTAHAEKIGKALATGSINLEAFDRLRPAIPPEVTEQLKVTGERASKLMARVDDAQWNEWATLVTGFSAEIVEEQQRAGGNPVTALTKAVALIYVTFLVAEAFNLDLRAFGMKLLEAALIKQYLGEAGPIARAAIRELTDRRTDEPDD